VTQLLTLQNTSAFRKAAPGAHVVSAAGSYP
jgi:hypothetical protein